MYPRPNSRPVVVSRGITYSLPIIPSPPDSAADAALFFATSKSRPSCSHHLRDTLNPGLRADCSQRARIGRIAIYCATVFYLLLMYFPIPSKPASTIASYIIYHVIGDYLYYPTGSHHQKISLLDTFHEPTHLQKNSRKSTHKQ